MNLLKTMEREVHPSLGGKLSGKDKHIYKEAKKEFLSRIDCSLTGVEKIRAIYMIADELTEIYRRDNFISCQRGCYWCCHQLVCCTKLEMELILGYLWTLPSKKKAVIKKKGRKAGIKYIQFCNNLANQSSLIQTEEIAEPMKEFYRFKPCLYLGGRDCLIYPVRPIECRNAKTDSVGICGPVKEIIAKPRKIRLFADQVASDLITEEEKKIHGQLRMIPLPAWPVSEDFADNFF